MFDRAAGLSVGAITDWVANGAGWLMGQLAGLIDRTTSPKLEAEWFASHYRTMLALAGVVVLPLLLVSVLGAIVAQDAGRLLRTVFGHLPMAGIFAAAAAGLVSMGLAVTDGMTAWVAQGAGADAAGFLGRSAGALRAVAGDDQALFAVFLGAIVMAVGAVVVWIELLVRQAAVYVAVLFLPLSIAGIVWPATAHWCKRLVHILVAVVLSKFVIAAILSLAASGLAASGDEGGFGAVLSGGALLTLAALSPLALLRLVPIVEANVVSSASVRRPVGATAATLGGGGWLYGQAKGWMARDDNSPAPRTWARPATAAAAGGAGPVGGAVAVANAAGRSAVGQGRGAAHGLSQLPGSPDSTSSPSTRPPVGSGESSRPPRRDLPAPPRTPDPTPPPRRDVNGNRDGH